MGLLCAYCLLLVINAVVAKPGQMFAFLVLLNMYYHRFNGSKLELSIIVPVYKYKLLVQHPNNTEL